MTKSDMREFYCCACGPMIEYEESKIFSEKESWRVAKRTQGKQVIHCSAVELDMMYFKTPWMWSSLFRLSEFNKVLFCFLCLSSRPVICFLLNYGFYDL